MNDLIKAALAADSECPDLESLLTSLSLEKHDLGYISANTHVDRCPRCRAYYLLQPDFEQATPTRQEAAIVESISAQLSGAVPVSRSKGPAPVLTPIRKWLWTRRFFSSLAAAAVLSAVAIGLHERNLDHPSFHTSGDVVYRSATLQAVSPVGDLQTVPLALHWTSTENAYSFRVTVMEVDGSVLYTKTTGETELTLPALVRDQFQPGRTLLWKVAALDAGGNVVQESNTERFRLIDGSSYEKR